MTLTPLDQVNEPPWPVVSVVIPDSKLTYEVTEFVRKVHSLLRFHHSSLVCYWGALLGKHRWLRFNHKLLYVGAMFRDVGLMRQFASADGRFEVDCANTAGDLSRSHGIDKQDIQTVWTAVALHKTPGTPTYIYSVIALTAAGVEMDVLDVAYSEFTDAEREAVLHAPTLRPP